MIRKSWRETFGGWSPSPSALLLWLAICTCTTSAALWFGDQHADDVIAQRERTIAIDVVASIEHMIDTAESVGRQFTQDVDDDAKALLASIVTMAHHFRLVVVAEASRPMHSTHCWPRSASIARRGIFTSDRPVPRRFSAPAPRWRNRSGRS